MQRLKLKGILKAIDIDNRFDKEVFLELLKGVLFHIGCLIKLEV